MKTYMLSDTGYDQENPASSEYSDGIADVRELSEQEVKEANEMLRRQGSSLRWIPRRNENEEYE